MTRFPEEWLDAKLANIRRWKAEEAKRSEKVMQEQRAAAWKADTHKAIAGSVGSLGNEGCKGTSEPSPSAPRGDALVKNVRPCAGIAGVAPGPLTINAARADAATDRADAGTTAGQAPPAGADAAKGGTPFVVVPWPPSGNTGVRHSSNGGHYINPRVIAYRKTVAAKCAGAGKVAGRYRISVHFSPPDRRARDMDNALKTLLDALVACKWLPNDSMTYMRELRATVDDHRRGLVAVEVTEE